VSSWVNALALGVVLWRRGFLRPDDRLKHRLPRILAATVLMAAALAAAQWGLADLFRASTVLRVVALATLIGVGLAVFGAACLALGAAHPRELRAALGRKA
jgi:putative peptidoglycan lipid II flippase